MKAQKMKTFLFLLLLLSQKAYPSTTPVVRVIEGYEPYEFIRFFPWWQDFDLNGNRPTNLLGKFDALSLIQRPHLAAESQLIDDGHGEMVIYRVGAKGDIVEVPKRSNIALFSGDCYLIHYVLTVKENFYSIFFLVLINKFFSSR